MSLWMERYHELDRYYSYRQEAEEHRLASQGRVRQENALLINRNSRSILPQVALQVGTLLYCLKQFLPQMVSLPFTHHSFQLKERG